MKTDKNLSQQWREYSRKYNIWKNTKYESDMARAMSKPNEPGYYRANND